MPDHIEELEQLLTPRQFCRRWQISPATFWRRVRAGDIRVVRLGPGIVRVPADQARPAVAEARG